MEMNKWEGKKKKKRKKEKRKRAQRHDGGGENGADFHSFFHRGECCVFFIDVTKHRRSTWS